MFDFEKMEVYKKAYEANRILLGFLKTNTSLPLYAKDQLGRASLSFLLNIAEGNGRFGFRDKRRFFIIARASVNECSTLMHLYFDDGEIPEELKVRLIGFYEQISKMLFKLIKILEAK